MTRTPVFRAWAMLIGLSLGSTLISLWHWPTAFSAGAGTLILTFPGSRRD